MSLIDTIKNALGMGGTSIRLQLYECQECGNQFESAKRPDRVQCMDCLSQDVELVGEGD